MLTTVFPEHLSITILGSNCCVCRVYKPTRTLPAGHVLGKCGPAARDSDSDPCLSGNGINSGEFQESIFSCPLRIGQKEEKVKLFDVAKGKADS